MLSISTAWNYTEHLRHRQTVFLRKEAKSKIQSGKKRQLLVELSNCFSFKHKQRGTMPRKLKMARHKIEVHRSERLFVG